MEFKKFTIKAQHLNLRFNVTQLAKNIAAYESWDSNFMNLSFIHFKDELANKLLDK